MEQREPDALVMRAAARGQLGIRPIEIGRESRGTVRIGPGIVLGVTSTPLADAPYPWFYAGRHNSGHVAYVACDHGEQTEISLTSGPVPAWNDPPPVPLSPHMFVDRRGEYTIHVGQCETCGRVIWMDHE